MSMNNLNILSFANQNRPIYKMAVLKSKMAAAKKHVRSGNEDLHDIKQLKTSKIYNWMQYIIKLYC